MPQAPRSGTRQDTKEARRAAEKETKRAQGAMSCAECRRLKLKCDKTIPCSSCRRRGCSQICPNGSLVTGQGTRFVLADTEKLHDKINAMSDRIRQLEDALTLLQSTITRDQHPLLSKDLLQIKSIIELHGAFGGEAAGGKAKAEKPEAQVDAESQYIDAFGTMAIRDDGATTFYGRSAGTESLLITENSDPNLQRKKSPQYLQASWQPQLPEYISRHATSFPFSAAPTEGLDLDFVVQNFLPPWEEAWRLSELYLEQGPWFYGPVARKQIIEEMLPMWYPEAARLLPPSGSVPKPSASSSGPGIDPENGPRGAHELALLFIVFAYGALIDISLPPLPDNPEAERYYQLTCMALALEPVLDRPPLVSTVQTLSLMAIYQGLLGEHNLESTWTIFGMATKLAQSLGLHRDPARWKLSPFEVQKRRGLFWELFITDSWLSLATGRVATFSHPFVDCEQALDPDETLADDGTPMPSFPAWKARFGAECVAYVVQGTVTAKPPKYSVILELDRKIRDMLLPKYCHDAPPQGAGWSQIMSHYMPIEYRHLTLIYVHRCFFAEAIKDCPQDPMKSQYAPSFLAGYRSACELLGAVRVQFQLFPAHVARYWNLWTHSFSGAVMLASIVTRATGVGLKSKVTSAAMLQLKSACELFAEAASYGGRAVKFLPILQRLLQKAEDVLKGSRSPPLRNDIFAPTPRDDNKDEFQIFSGQTHTVATKSNIPPSQSRSSRLPSNHASSSSIESQPSPYPYPEMHPMLVDQLNEFEGHLDAQIHSTYENDPHSVNPYIPVASSGYHEPFEQHPSSAHYHYSQPHDQSSLYSHPNTSQTSYHQPIYNAPTTQYGYMNDQQETLHYPVSAQNQHWSAEVQGQYHNPGSYSGETLVDRTYGNPHHPPPQTADQHSLQDTWSSFVYTVGSPPPFAMD